MALRLTQIPVEVREVSLREKPEAMLAISPKGTVPVLHLADGRVIEESLEIMKWALEHSVDSSLCQSFWKAFDQALIDQMIGTNDRAFKRLLDRYKYPERYPEFKREQTLAEIEQDHLVSFEERLSKHSFLFGEQASLADLAIFPFIRQFAKVDEAWFEQAPYPSIQRWLRHWLQSPLFLDVMIKYPTWKEGVH